MNLDQQKHITSSKNNNPLKSKPQKNPHKKQPLKHFFILCENFFTRHIKKKLMGKSLNLENTVVKLVLYKV